MIYSSEEIKLFNTNKQQLSIAVSRYLNKFHYDYNNFNRLKPHEKDFIFGCMEFISENNRKIYNL